MEHPHRRERLLRAINRAKEKKARRRVVVKAFKAAGCIALVASDSDLLRRLTGKEPSLLVNLWRVYIANHDVLRRCLPYLDGGSRERVLEFLKAHEQRRPSRRVWSWRNRGRRLWAYQSKRTVQLCSLDAGLLRELTGREPRATRYGYYYDLRHLSAS